MARRLLLCLACLLIVVTPAAAGDIIRKKREIDTRISALDAKIADAKAKEGVLSTQIGVVNAQIRSLESDVSRAQATLNTLEGRLAASRRKLERMTELFNAQTQRLRLLRKEYTIALARLQRRLIDAYETPDPNTLDVLLASTSMANMLNDIEYLQQIGRQDKHVADKLNGAKKAMSAARRRTAAIKQQILVETAAARARAAQQHAVTAALISSAQQLATARESKQSTLDAIKVNESEFSKEANALRAASADLAAKIRASAGGASSGTGAPSSSGFIWPVSGPITSPFGARCLGNGDCSSHPGIDIAVPSGTPIHASASGRVIYAGWMSGYGNLTVIDHGNGLATAYGHQSSIAVGNGTSVSQGQTIGYVGCTGYCFGAHLHFEVRVNGEPVNPLNYL
jgi:murein DD-endopeptidase MepM/ murein hydrolase activator NlpD